MTIPEVEPLLPAVAAGDADAVDRVLERYGPLIWSVVTRGLRDRAQAEDLVQEIFIEIWRSADRYDPTRGSEAVFLTTIARRRLVDVLRRTARRPESENVDEIEVAAEHPAFEHIAQKEEAQRALDAFSDLAPEQRKVLLMSIQDGLSHSQIADHAGLALGTVKSYIRRGLARVAEALERGRGKEVTA